MVSEATPDKEDTSGLRHTSYCMKENRTDERWPGYYKKLYMFLFYTSPSENTDTLIVGGGEKYMVC